MIITSCSVSRISSMYCSPCYCTGLYIAGLSHVFNFFAVLSFVEIRRESAVFCRRCRGRLINTVSITEHKGSVPTLPLKMSPLNGGFSPYRGPFRNNTKIPKTQNIKNYYMGQTCYLCYLFAVYARASCVVSFSIIFCSTLIFYF